ncbi:MAG: alpha/beta hydrolase [Methanobacteriota archaeon]|nr:MAG: alpha/beta hydrolase [Euryarchaeota archaeon]
MDSTFIKTNGIRLHAVTAGDPTDPLIVLLHGFPEFWKGWEKQIPLLADQGYFVVAPDQRGYNLSDKPWRIGAYTQDKLAMDIAGLIRQVGKDSAVVAGHDWGAAVAWHLAANFPEIVEKLVIVNVPHRKAFERRFRSDPVQRKKSRYMLQFQLPLLPQWMLRRKDFSALAAALTKTSKPGTFSQKDISEYKEAWRQKRAIPCMLNWYRAAFRRRLKLRKVQVEPPTLILWGRKDRFLREKMAEESLEFCKDGHVKFFDDATHWILHESPRETTNAILDFLS